MKFFCNKYFLLATIIFLGVFFAVQNTLAAACPVSTDVYCSNNGNCPTGTHHQTADTCPIAGNVCCVPNTAATCPGVDEVCKDVCDPATEIQRGTCSTKKCCAPITQSGSCSGGQCVQSGATCPSGTTPSGVCSAADGGGTCCKSGTPGGGGTTTSIEFKNPLAYNTVEEVLNSILGTLRSIIVTLALVFLVVGAVLYITSAGNEGTMKIAKGAITAAMIGLAIGLAAPSFLLEIGKVLGWGAVNAGPVAGARTLSQIALSVLEFLLSIVGILAIIMLVWGGIMYMTGATTGDEKNKVENGKKIVKYAIIGIFVALASLVIVSQIATFFL